MNLTYHIMVLYESYVSHKLLQIVLLWTSGLYDKRDTEGGSCWCNTL